MIAKQIFQFALPGQVVVMLVLTALIMISGVAVAFVKYESRMLFTEMEKLRTYRDGLANDWMLLQLELATLARHDLVEQGATGKLQMHMPEHTEIRVLYGK